MSNKNIEFHSFYDHFEDLNGWEIQTEEFEQSQNLLKILERKIALPKV